MNRFYQGCFLAIAAIFLCSTGLGAQSVLFFDDFDADSTADWNSNEGVGFDQSFLGVPMDTSADFFFDYSSAGIPPAPNSAGGSTRGMKLQANLTSDAFGGFTVSPKAQSFTGDYAMLFDAWSSTVGPFPFGGSGSTNMSSFGLLTSGTQSNIPLSTDGVWFSYTGDAGSAADYRVFSIERDIGYQLPAVDAVDMHAIHHAGTRNGTGQLYIDAMGANKTVPQSIIDANPAAELGGTLFEGAPGFAWNQHEIRKIENTIEWYVNGFLLITLEADDFIASTGGNNILFGHWDVNFSSSNDPNKEELLFTLIDNVSVVSLVPEPASCWIIAMALLVSTASGRRLPGARQEL